MIRCLYRTSERRDVGGTHDDLGSLLTLGQANQRSSDGVTRLFNCSQVSVRTFSIWVVGSLVEEKSLSGGGDSQLWRSGRSWRGGRGVAGITITLDPGPLPLIAVRSAEGRVRECGSGRQNCNPILRRQTLRIGAAFRAKRTRPIAAFQQTFNCNRKMRRSQY